MTDNSKLLTREERQAIRERANKATPEPWKLLAPQTPAGSQRILEVLDPKGSSVVAWPGFDSADGSERQKYADAKFIAHSREDVPALLRHVETLEAKLRDCSKAVDALLMLIDLEAPPDFGSNGIVGPGGGPDEGRVLTYELMNRCRDASKRAGEVLK